MASPAKNLDLHGSAPDRSSTALLLIDVINALEFEGAEKLGEPALAMARAIAELKRRCARAGLPAIYVNDDFGRWREDQHVIIARAQAGSTRPAHRRAIEAGSRGLFRGEVQHSGFFATPLDTLLTYLRVRTVILTGIGTELCVHFTAAAAYMRDYHLIVPPDCVTGIDPREGVHALQPMSDLLQTDIRPPADLGLEEAVPQSRARVSRISPRCFQEVDRDPEKQWHA